MRRLLIAGIVLPLIFCSEPVYATAFLQACLLKLRKNLPGAARREHHARIQSRSAELAKAVSTSTTIVESYAVLRQYREAYGHFDYDSVTPPAEYERLTTLAAADAISDLAAVGREDLTAGVRRAVRDDIATYKEFYKRKADRLQTSAIERARAEPVTEGGLSVGQEILALEGYVAIKTKQLDLPKAPFDLYGTIDSVQSKSLQLEFDAASKKGKLALGTTFASFLRKRAHEITEAHLRKITGNDHTVIEPDWLAQAQRRSATLEADSKLLSQERTKKFFENPERLKLLDQINRSLSNEERGRLIDQVIASTLRDEPSHADVWFDEYVDAQHDLIGRLSAMKHLSENFHITGKVQITGGRPEYIIDLKSLPTDVPYFARARALAETNNLTVVYEDGIYGGGLSFTVIRGAFNSSQRKLVLTKSSILKPAEGERALKHEETHILSDNQLRAGVVPALTGEIVKTKSTGKLYDIRSLDEVIAFRNEAVNRQSPNDEYVQRSNTYAGENIEVAQTFLAATATEAPVPFVSEERAQHPLVTYVHIRLGDHELILPMLKSEFANASPSAQRNLLRERVQGIISATKAAVQ